jgi:ABC-type lipoprotein export system ATPase subunit
MLIPEIGSVWRKWDLQVHTPFSYLNNGFGNDWDYYVKVLFKTAIENNIYAIGITDYFTIDGYKKIKNDYLGNINKLKSLFTKEEIERINNILIIPNIEFRLDVLVPSSKTASRINFHVLFSEEVKISDIEEHFLHEIDFDFEGNPQSTDEKRKLKVSNLIELGSKLRSEHEPFKNDSDLFVGMKTAYVSSSQICNILNKSKFKHKYILALPADEDISSIPWNSQGHNARKTLIQKVDCLLTSNSNTISWALGKKHENVKSFVKEFKSVKPSIWGSDSHNYDEIFTKNKDKTLWIKSDLSFDGLRQILHEPNRVYIGKEPESKKYVDLNPSLFIEKLIINKIDKLPSDEEWFGNLDINLNSGLVAIIGNKGSGKSAIADIIGLCGNTRNLDYFSFLTDKRFNMPPERKSQYFEASILWKSQLKNSINISKKPLEFDQERVKYLPQSFLEKLCLGESEKELFENELRKIIFSRLPDEKRLGKNSLNEIINFQTEPFLLRIEQTKAEINLLNKKIIELEEQSHQEYIQKIHEEINSYHKTLKALNDRIPIEPDSSKSKSDSATLAITSELEYKRDIHNTIEELIANTIKEKNDISIELQELKNSIEFFNSLKIQLDKSLALHINLLEIYSIPIESIFNYSINLSQLEDIYKSKSERLVQITEMLKENYISNSNGIVENIDYQLLDKSTSLYKLKSEVEQEIAELQSRLDLPTKEYQIYLSNYNIWQQEVDSVLAEIQVLEKKKEYLEIHHSYVLASHYKDRVELVTTLFYYKFEIIKVYRELFQPVITFKENYKNELSQYKIDFDAKFIVNQFLEKFESYINFAKSGSFYGKEPAIKKINELLNSYDLNQCDGVLAFQQSLTQSLLSDDKFNDKKIRHVSSQLKQNIKVEDMYEFIFGLDYLEPKFQLKLGNKEITSLSPGERGALLLIFYLLLDNDKMPLIIDQPEENLDNQSIYSILVPFIQEAKKRRQVILVTHNPNLAVVCDADQIIHVKIDKNDKHIITCTSGSIENARINQLLIEVLEGTFPAFDTRNHRYDITRSRIN